MAVLSQEPQRQRAYHDFLTRLKEKPADVAEIAQFGHQLMRQAKVHHHFFGNNSLYANALYLTLFSLKLPYNPRALPKNQDYLANKIEQQQAFAILTLFEQLISQRIPVEYITQEAFYMDHIFYVNHNVLVPRSLMHNHFADFLKQSSWTNYRVLDLCTGSGCIGITLALMQPHITVDLVDISAAALAVAQINLDKFNLRSRVKCIQSDLFSNVHDKYDLIITNPPYVSDKEYRGQPLEIKNEPKLALHAGRNGLEVLNKIILEAKPYLNPQGLLIAEVGYNAASLLKLRYPKTPFKWLKSKAPDGKESVVDRIIRWSGLLDSVFICPAKDLPSKPL